MASTPREGISQSELDLAMKNYPGDYGDYLRQHRMTLSDVYDDDDETVTSRQDVLTTDPQSTSEVLAEGNDVNRRRACLVLALEALDHASQIDTPEAVADHNFEAAGHFMNAYGIDELQRAKHDPATVEAMVNDELRAFRASYAGFKNKDARYAYEEQLKSQQLSGSD